MRADVIVAGAGPAGLSLAGELARAGLDTMLLGPDHEARWPATYGAWLDEVDDLGLVPDATDLTAATWDRVTATGMVEHELGRTYALFDNDALKHTLVARAAGVRRVAGTLAGASPGRRGTTAITGDGRLLEAALLVDATGPWPATLLRPGRPRPAYQSAFGLTATFAHPPAPDGSAVLMDWRGPDGPDPTFLYAFDLGEGRWFVEETSLARRAALHDDVLQARLLARLAAAGAQPTAIGASEHVLIPMGQALPYRGQVVGFGAAASMVHPATGYSVVRSLRVAPRVAAAAADALRVRRTTPSSLAQVVWDAVWPAPERRVRALEVYGLGALLRLDRRGLQGFFDAFFSLPPEQWHGYLAGTLTPAEMAATMRALFARAPLAVKARLARGNPATLALAAR